MQSVKGSCWLGFFWKAFAIKSWSCSVSQVPVQKQVMVPQVTTIQKHVEVPQVEYVDQEVEARPIARSFHLDFQTLRLARCPCKSTDMCLRQGSRGLQ